MALTEKQITDAFPTDSDGKPEDKQKVILSLNQSIETLEEAGKSKTPHNSGGGSDSAGSDSVGGSGDALPDDIRESIAIANAKSVAEQPSMLSNLAFANLLTNGNLSQQNAVSNQQAINQLAVTVVGNAVNRVSDLSPMEAIAVNKLDTGND
ncbi:hypothetical protein BI308_17370, partial [Roseofilum reptotaenium AO1-A]